MPLEGLTATWGRLERRATCPISGPPPAPARRILDGAEARKWGGRAAGTSPARARRVHGHAGRRGRGSRRATPARRAGGADHPAGPGGPGRRVWSTASGVTSRPPTPPARCRRTSATCAGGSSPTRRPGSVTASSRAPVRVTCCGCRPTPLTRGPSRRRSSRRRARRQGRRCAPWRPRSGCGEDRRTPTTRGSRGRRRRSPGSPSCERWPANASSRRASSSARPSSSSATSRRWSRRTRSARSAGASSPLALYRAHRQAAALAALRRAREVLADELGVDPGPALRSLEAEVLAQSPGLDAPTPAAARDATALVPRPRTPDGLVDRDREMAVLRTRSPSWRGRTPGCLLIEGPAGIGKTRLLDEVRRLAAAAGVPVRSARSSSAGAGLRVRGGPAALRHGASTTSYAGSSGSPCSAVSARSTTTLAETPRSCCAWTTSSGATRHRCSSSPTW